MNGDIFNPECNGIDGVLAAYENCIEKCQLYGPTNFAEIISAINARSEAVPARQEDQTYQILLIITDGVITDLEATIDELVRCSEQPMSVIIVGVGDADFHKMTTLDADQNPLYSAKHGKYQQRDNVQFVPFNQCKGDPYRLARTTLEELPA